MSYLDFSTHADAQSAEYKCRRDMGLGKVGNVTKKWCDVSFSDPNYQIINPGGDWSNSITNRNVVNAPDTGAMTLTFQDDFTGASLDTTKWNTQYWFGRTNSSNGEQQWYIDTAFTQNNSILTITATNTETQPGFPYSSGIITSHQKFSQTYGYFSARIKLPSGQGLWPAFWMLPESEGWPPELDIFENLGNDTSVLYGTSHYTQNGSNLGEGETKYAPADLSADYHTYSMHWTADHVALYLDDLEYFRVYGDAVPHEPMYLVLNLAVGGNWPGSPDQSTVFPASLLVDWVRAWEEVS